MTPLAVRCILRDMEQGEWTEAQVIQYAQDHHYRDMTSRKLKRFRREGVLSTPRVDHPGFGGTTSVYPAEAGPRVLAICRLLKQRRDFNAVRMGLWLEGYPIELDRLKESLWRLVPFSTLETPSTERERLAAARHLTRRIKDTLWKSVRSNLVRKILDQFDESAQQRYFTSLLTQLLYGVPVDFTPTLLGSHDADLDGILEEPTDIFAHGLQMQRLRFLPKESAPDFQRLSAEKVLSLTWQRTVLLEATEEELDLARSRHEIIEQLFEALDAMGYLNTLHRFYMRLFRRPGMQALLLVLLLVLERGGYGPNIEMIHEALRTNLPLLRRYQQVRQTLQQELPDVASALLPLFQVSTMFTEGSQREQEAHIEHVREVYRQHKEALDTFWQRHPELSDEIQTVAKHEDEISSQPPSSASE
jgi:hypothetical protein